MSVLYELAYSFNHDDPFESDTGKKRVKALKQSIQQHMRIDFASMENEIKFYSLAPLTAQLYGDKTKKKKINNIEMINDFKDIVNPSTFPQMRSFNNYLSKFGGEVMTGGDEPEDVNNTQPPTDQPPAGNADAKPLVQDDFAFNSIIPIIPSKFDSKKKGVSNYDLTTGKLLTYEDLRVLTVNIARSRASGIVEKSEQILALEREKRKQLVNNIQKYRNINAIGRLTESCIEDMDLAQLEHTLNYCERLFQSEKLKETIKRGTNFGGLVFDTVFPEGIKVTKTKRIKPKGIGKAIINNIFDTQSTVGVAFQNIVDKHNWNITDEAVLMLSIGELFISNLKVETVAPEPEQKTKPDKKEEAEPMEYEEEEEEEGLYEYESDTHK